MGKKKKKERWSKWIPLYIMGLPGLIYLFINNYMPMYGLIIAFKKYDYSKGAFQSPWTGLENFKFLFTSNSAWIITRNTILYNVAFIIINMIVGVTLALFLNEVRNKHAKKLFQTVMLLPHLMSMVIIAFVVYTFLGDRTGLINAMIRRSGGKAISFYSEKKYWPFILIFVNAWKSAGYGSIIYLSSIVGIDETYYEAAALDGATRGQQIRKITLPLIKPTIITLLTMSMGGIFRSDFGLFYQIPRNQGLLYAVTDTIDTYVYRALMENGNIGVSSAVAFYQSIVCFVMIMGFNQLVKKISSEQALF